MIEEKSMLRNRWVQRAPAINNQQSLRELGMSCLRNHNLRHGQIYQYKNTDKALNFPYILGQRRPITRTGFLPLLREQELLYSPGNAFWFSSSPSITTTNSFANSAVEEASYFDSSRTVDESEKGPIKEQNSWVESSLSFEDRDQRAKFVQHLFVSAALNED